MNRVKAARTIEHVTGAKFLEWFKLVDLPESWDREMHIYLSADVLDMHAAVFREGDLEHHMLDYELIEIEDVDAEESITDWLERILIRILSPDLWTLPSKTY